MWTWIRGQAFLLLKVTASVCLLAVSVSGQEIATDRKRVTVSPDRAQVVLQGTWRRTSTRPSVHVPSVNSTRVECDRNGAICAEYLAKFIQKEDDDLGTISHPSLFLMKEQFRVVQWTERMIVARAKAPAADIELRINLVEETAQRTFQETPARPTKTKILGMCQIGFFGESGAMMAGRARELSRTCVVEPPCSLGCREQPPPALQRSGPSPRSRGNHSAGPPAELIAVRRLSPEEMLECREKYVN